jgi:hypothetical protein
MMASDGTVFQDPVDFTAGMRPNDPAHFYGTDAKGNKVNFITKIHRDAMRPPLQKLLFSRKVEPLTEAERGTKLFGRTT